MFGVENAALRSPRKSLCLNETVEKGFDNGWIAIIPDGSVEASPTEWKMVVSERGDSKSNCVHHARTRKRNDSLGRKILMLLLP